MVQDNSPPPLARAAALRKTSSRVQTFVACCWRLRLIDDRRRPALSVAEMSIGTITRRFGDATRRTATPDLVSALPSELTSTVATSGVLQCLKLVILLPPLCVMWLPVQRSALL